MPTDDQIIFTRSATGTTHLTDEEIDNLFPDVTAEQAAAGLVDYQGLFIRNLSTADDPLMNAEVDITARTPSPDTQIKIAVGPANLARAAAAFIGVDDTGTTTTGGDLVLGTPSTVLNIEQPIRAVAIVEGEVYVASYDSNDGVTNFAAYPAVGPFESPRAAGGAATDLTALTSDGTYLWDLAANGNFFNRSPIVGRGNETFRTDFPTSFVTAGMAFDSARNRILVCDGPSAVVYEYTVRESENQLRRLGTVPAPTGVSSSEGFAANTTHRFYGDAAGVVRAYDSDGDLAAMVTVGGRIRGMSASDTVLFVGADDTATTDGKLVMIPLTTTGATRTGSLPIDIGNFTGTRRLWIERTVRAGAGFFANDMPSITVREKEDE